MARSGYLQALALMFEKRRSLRNDPAFMLAVLYTCGFLGMCFLVILKEVSKESAPIVQQLLSIMSMIQAGIAGFFYGASKSSAESTQAMSRIAEAAAPSAALAVAAATGAAATSPAFTPAPPNPETGVIPAAEVAKPPGENTP